MFDALVGFEGFKNEGKTKIKQTKKKSSGTPLICNSGTPCKTDASFLTFKNTGISSYQ